MSTLPHDSTGAVPRNTSPIVSTPRCNLDAVVKEFEAAAESLGISRPSTQELTEKCGQVAALTSELFGGEWSVEIRVDPEIRDDLYFVFEVRATGSVDELVARHDQWHRRIMRTEGKWHGLFRLSIDAN